MSERFTVTEYEGHTCIHDQVERVIAVFIHRHFYAAEEAIMYARYHCYLLNKLNEELLAYEMFVEDSEIYEYNDSNESYKVTHKQILDEYNGQEEATQEDS